MSLDLFDRGGFDRPLSANGSAESRRLDTLFPHRSRSVHRGNATIADSMGLTESAVELIAKMTQGCSSASFTQMFASGVLAHGESDGQATRGNPPYGPVALRVQQAEVVHCPVGTTLIEGE
ncbi:MAG: hypothetical protein KatS3mg108_0930 [Isosphaeraceae bacterium]|jgi:hypothetical protein|nr:MAG: hypothetical protein KatS3mg108_0930 [Isosphaeraceae bacterium]